MVMVETGNRMILSVTEAGPGAELARLVAKDLDNFELTGF